MHGKDDATDHMDQLKVWFGDQWPQANIGLVTGTASSVVVLDVDPRNGGDVELERLWALHEPFPAGPVAATGGGGWHYYFKHPGTAVRSRNGIVGEGLDVKADGGYVIAPPSVHRTGMSYEWCEGLAPWEVATPPLPTWLLVLMTQDNASPFEGAAEIPSLIREGMRRTHLLSIAGSMRHRGMSERAICAALMAENEEKCTPPMIATEIAQLASAAAKWAPGEATLLSSSGAAAKRPVVGKVARHVPQTFTGVQLCAEDLPEVSCAVANLLPEGLAVLAGKPKMGKSFMSFNIGVAIAQGGIVMGDIPVDEGDVLILALEDNKRRLKKRLLQMLAGDAPPERLHMETEWPREDEGGLDLLDQWLGLHAGTKLVVIDTLARFRRSDGDRKYQDDYAAIAGLAHLAGLHQVCILLITHFRKAISEDGDWVDNITGTLGIAGAADTLLGLTRSRNGHDAILHVTGRDVEPQDLALRWNGIVAQWHIEGKADEYQMGQETTKLLAVLIEIGGPAKANDIAAFMDKKRGATARLLQRAANEGLIKNYGNGMYGQKAAEA